MHSIKAKTQDTQLDDGHGGDLNDLFSYRVF